MWIDEYREAHGLELDEFARLVNIAGREIHYPWYGTVTDELIYILERSKKPRTHPHIADAIATVCGATVEQRDSIVATKHRGSWVAPEKPFTWNNPPTIHKRNNNDFSVVMVDANAKIIRRYKSAKIAAMYGDLGEDSIQRRCQHRVPNEFTDERPYTYRYARKWDCLSMAEKYSDLGVDMLESKQ